MPQAKKNPSPKLSPLITEYLALAILVLLIAHLLIRKPLSLESVAGISDTPIVPTPTPSSHLVSLNPVTEPQLSAKAIFVWEPTTNTLLLSQNPHLRLSPASTTKLMTAWVALKQYSPETLVTVKDADRSVGQTADLIAGETLSVENLVKAMLINSGNDAALALAQHHPQGYAHFVDLMNQEAQKLGLINTHFTNVSGLEEPNHFSSAYDLSHLAYTVSQHPLINQFIQTKTAAISDLSGSNFHSLENTNKLLWQNNGVNGIKTGWTEEAGECLITRVIRPEYPLIITLLGSADRFGESQTLIDWAYTNFMPN